MQNNDNIMGSESLSNEKVHFSRVGVVLAIYIVFNTLAQLLIIQLLKKFVSPDNISLNLIITLGLASQYILGFPLVVFLLSNEPLSVIDKHGIKLKNFFQLLSLSVVLIYIGSIISEIFNSILGAIMGHPVPHVFATMINSLNPIIVLIATVFVAPVVEEIIFRRIIIGRTIKYGEKISIVFSAFCFGIMHGNLDQIFFAFLLGLLLGYLYVRTGKLYLTILLHMCINGLSTITLFLVKPLLPLAEELTKFQSGNSPSKIIELLSLNKGAVLGLVLYFFVYSILFFYGIYILIRMRKRLVLNAGLLGNKLNKSTLGVVFKNAGVIAFILVVLFLISDSLGLIPPSMFGF